MTKIHYRTYERHEYDWMRWGAMDISHAVEVAIDTLRTTVDAIITTPSEEQTFTTTIERLEYAQAALMTTLSQVYFLGNVAPRAAVRERALAEVTRSDAEVRLIIRQRSLYAACKRGARRGPARTPEGKRLTSEWLRHFKRLGFDLAPEAERRLLTTWEETTALETAFSRAINDDVSYVLVSERELCGLPATYRAMLTRDQKTQKYRVHLSYPEFVPFMQRSESAAARRRLYMKYVQKGGQKNVTRLERIVTGRMQAAAMLGYDSHADYQIEGRLAKNADQARAFIVTLLDAVKGSARADLRALRDLKRRHTGDRRAAIELWDMSFYSERLRQERYALDSEEIRAYFPLEHVIAETLGFFARLYGVQFERMDDVPLWHRDAELYRVVARNGQAQAHIVLDLYPRKGKYAHAAVFDLVQGHADPDRGKASYTPPMAALVCNFPRSTARHASCLSHSEVITFLHEMGHLLHATLTQAHYPSQSGLSVAHDFVETPSQMTEHFGWEIDVLMRLSKHRDTGASLPRETIMQMRRAQTHLSAYDTARQCIYALYDLDIHTSPVHNLREHYSILLQKHLGLAMPRTQKLVAGWGHLMGYDAGYYAYLWADVSADDFYTVFERLPRAQAARRYKREVLARGSERSERATMRAFLGRQPSNKAFLKNKGISK